MFRNRLTRTRDSRSSWRIEFLDMSFFFASSCTRLLLGLGGPESLLAASIGSFVILSSSEDSVLWVQLS
jgi:hypothetical protein